MSDETKTATAHAGGIVDLGGTLFHVRALDFYAEVGLWELLRAEAKKTLGPGGFVAAALPAIKWLRENGHAEEAAALQRDANAMVLTRAAVSDDAVEEYRRTPDGVAKELFHRTREAHPDVAEREFRAAVNQVTALGVFHQMRRAVSGPKEPTPSPSPGGS